MVRMGEYVTVSVKVPKEVKEKMTRLEVNWGRVLRQAIEQELQKAERVRAVDAILELAQRAPKTEYGTAVKLVVRDGALYSLLLKQTLSEMMDIDIKKPLANVPQRNDC